jgi:DNA-directed RNA polymerase specialized sigma24 family protein
MLCRAHGGADGKLPAQHALLERYGGASYRYLLGAVRDPEAAAELTQDFAVRFLRGDFRRPDPGKGRFRDYLKTALIHMATDHRRAKAQQPRSLHTDTPALPIESPDDDAMFLASWRAELLDRTWDALAHASPTGHAILMLHVAEPDLSSAQMALRFNDKPGREMNADGVRKSLQRAHERFAELLVEEVARSLDGPEDSELEAELSSLDLLRYCRSALAARRSRSAINSAKSAH